MLRAKERAQGKKVKSLEVVPGLKTYHSTPMLQKSSAASMLYKLAETEANKLIEQTWVYSCRLFSYGRYQSERQIKRDPIRS